MRNVDEWPAWIDSVVYPKSVPAGRCPDKFLDKTTGRRILGFDFQAAVDTDVDIRLDHGYGRGWLSGLGDIGRIAYEDVDNFGRVPGAGSIQHLNSVGGHGCNGVAGFPLFGFLEVVDVVNDAVGGVVAPGFSIAPR